MDFAVELRKRRHHGVMQPDEAAAGEDEQEGGDTGDGPEGSAQPAASFACYWLCRGFSWIGLHGGFMDRIQCSGAAVRLL